MPKLILLLALALAGWIIYQRLLATPPARRKAAYVKLGLGALIVIVIIGVATGRMHWLGAAITGLLVGASRLLPVLIRLFPMLQWLQQRSGGTIAGGAGSSEVETAFLRMTLDHDSGDLTGKVLQGEFAGQDLDTLDLAQLERLLTHCREQDTDSARLLESYLERRFGDAWQGGYTPPPDNASGMSEAEALAILGLQPGASKEDIVDAHRRLMQKLHPDRGGNDYLAAKLNEAKALLLG
ncbi:MAG: molecular chaperone DnaJ [Halieaceae bacterium]|nr:molecular chaperone DnaJ [Halieaceae bacterium]